MILLIEQDPTFAELIRLANDGVCITSSLVEAREYLENRTVHLVFVDGLETLKALREYGIPKVLITKTPGDGREAMKAGAVDYVINDGDEDRVLTRVAFDIERFKPKPRLRFTPDRFEQIKACLV